MLLHKLPTAIRVPYARMPVSRIWFLETKWEDGHPVLVDWSKKWPLRVRMREWYLRKTIGLRSSVKIWWFFLLWRVGMHPDQRRNKGGG